MTPRPWFPHLDFAGEPMRKGQFREPYPMAEEADPCPDCGGAGERFDHADDCYEDSCALNGDIDSCNGQVVPCHCASPSSKSPS